MKPHQYAAVIVFIVAAAWVITGDFSIIGGSANAQDEQTAPAQVEKVEATAEEKDTEQVRALQSVAYAVIPSFDHQRVVRISGVTEADKETVLSARAGGVIKSLEVSKGDRVEMGQVIARIDPEGRDIMLQSADQTVKQRRAEVDAQSKLVESGTLPKLRLDETISALAAAEAQAAAQRAEIERLDIVAPFTGVVDELGIEPGNPVQAGVTVGQLIALDPIIGVGQVNESDLPQVKLGNKANLRLVNGQMVEGTIRYISKKSDAATRTYSVEIEAPNAALDIPAGMTTEVILRGEPVRATPVPRSIVTLNQAGDLGVRVVNGDDAVEFYPIDLIDDSSDALMLGGIPENARIIVVGQNIVSDGQKVEPVAAPQDQIDRLIAEATGGEGVTQ